jgi:hypothetical protein
VKQILNFATDIDRRIKEAQKVLLAPAAEDKMKKLQDLRSNLVAASYRLRRAIYSVAHQIEQLDQKKWHGNRPRSHV